MTRSFCSLALMASLLGAPILSRARLAAAAAAAADQHGGAGHPRRRQGRDERARDQVRLSGHRGTDRHAGRQLIFTETQANRITRIAPDGTTSTFLENTNGSNGLAFDAKGRLISVQTTPGQTKIGVIYPKGAKPCITDNFDGKAYGRPNDLVVSTQGRRLLHRARPECAAAGHAAAGHAAAAAGGLLRGAGRQGDEGRRRHRAAERHHAEPRREDALREQQQRRVPAGVRRQA